MSADAAYVEVAPFTPVEGLYTYAIPAGVPVVPGGRVLVPFGARPLVGLAIRTRSDLPDGLEPKRVRPIFDVLDEEALLGPHVLAILEWAAGYYLAPMGELCRAALPAGIHAKSARVAWAAGVAPPAGLSAAAAAVLDLLPATPPGVECRTVLKTATRARMRHFVELAKLGLAHLDYRLKRPGTRARTETLFVPGTAVPGDADTGWTPKRRKVLEAVQQAGEHGITSAALAATMTTPRPQLKWLEERDFVATVTREVYRDPFDGVAPERDEAPTWTDGQSAALTTIEALLTTGGYGAVLLHGITGSGKTEVYLEAIRQTAAAGRQALVLVPEIALTPQLAGRFRARFGDDVAVLHSGLSDGERYDQWRRIRRGEVRIAVGARSAVFAPFENLGVIVVDEEHDGSYKQEESPRYHARDLALVRAQRAGAVAILGSATPSLESMALARRGRITLIELPARATGGVLPDVELVDLRKVRLAANEPFAPDLARALKETLEQGSQTILFLNRRGWSSFVVCRACGHTFRCPNCSVGLTHHQRAARLRCHYCDHAEPIPTECPECSDPEVGRFGVGTEKLEEAVRQLLPEARVARLDRDTANRRTMQSLLDRMRAGGIDVLVGTQMVTKGHDFPGVTLVGVISADLGLTLPDFRAAERTFQLLTQVAGRAGRGDRPGRVLVQSFDPDHYALRAAADHDYATFAERELTLREELRYPPFGHLIAFRLDSEDEQRVEDVAGALKVALRESARRVGSVAILGPAPAALSKLRGRYRWHALVKGRDRNLVREVTRQARLAMEGAVHSTVRLAIDVDPVQML